jgi:hypothetical protein
LRYWWSTNLGSLSHYARVACNFVYGIIVPISMIGQD